jgi:hypothetical protein
MGRGVSAAIVFPAAVCLLVVALFVGTYLSVAGPGEATQTGSSTSTNSGSEMQGIITGLVTVGPSQPSCAAGQSCTENVGGYSLVFAPRCAGAPQSCETLMASIAPSGHYSILLDPGNYTVTGLYPSCPWPGCSTAFPKNVTVVGGMQIVYNFDIDTGIR